MLQNFNEVKRTSDIFCVIFHNSDGEKKPKKRSYEEIQPADEDSPTEPPQVMSWDKQCTKHFPLRQNYLIYECS